LLKQIDHLVNEIGIILAGTFFAVMVESYLFLDKCYSIVNTHANLFYIW